MACMGLMRAARASTSRLEARILNDFTNAEMPTSAIYFFIVIVEDRTLGWEISFTPLPMERCAPLSVVQTWRHCATPFSFAPRPPSD